MSFTRDDSAPSSRWHPTRRSGHPPSLSGLVSRCVPLSSISLLKSFHAVRRLTNDLHVSRRWTAYNRPMSRLGIGCLSYCSTNGFHGISFDIGGLESCCGSSRTACLSIPKDRVFGNTSTIPVSGRQGRPNLTGIRRSDPTSCGVTRVCTHSNRLFDAY